MEVEVAALLDGVGVQEIREGLLELGLLFNLIRVHICLIINVGILRYLKRDIMHGQILRLLPC